MLRSPRRIMAGICCLFVASGLLAPGIAPAQETVVTYQGRLLEAGTPADGLYDFRLTLFDTPAGGVPLASAQELPGQPVRDGLFDAVLDFGGAFSTSGDRWLEIHVRATGQPEFTLLGPRQRVAAAPRAVLGHAFGSNAVNSAGIVDQSVSAADIADRAVAEVHIVAGAIGANELQAGAIGVSEIADAAVGAAQIASDAVTAPKIASGAVTANAIAENAVGADKISASAVGTAEVATDAVTAAKIAAAAVGGPEIADGAITSTLIQDGSIGAAQIDSDEVQRRVTGSCPPGLSIRSVQSDGSVTCEGDSQGIADFGQPSEFLAFVTGGNGISTRALLLRSQALCMLSQVEKADVDGTNETGACRVFIAAGQWQLQASVTNSNDASVACMAICLPFVIVP